MRIRTIEQFEEKIKYLRFKEDSVLLVEGFLPHNLFGQINQILNQHRELIKIDYPMVHQPFNSDHTDFYITNKAGLIARQDSLSSQIQLIEDK